MSFFTQIENRKKLMLDNEREIRDYNAQLLPKLLRVSSALMCIPIIFSTFNEELRSCLLGYILLLLLCAVLAFAFHPKKMKKYSLVGIYLMFTGVYSLTQYLSLVCFPDRSAASALSFFCIMPLLFIDKRWRLTTVIFVYYIISMLLTFKIKDPSIARMDSVNCFVSVFLGMIAGDAVWESQLNAIDARRQLVIEKETDVLTGLSNRRKLFETISLLEAGAVKKPSGVLMLDIDHFKEVNDRHGHAAGDECLKAFGALLAHFERIYNISFYRYGGEEFVGLAYDGSEQELLTLADGIRVAVSRKSLGGLETTVSIGAAWCGDQDYTNLEQWIDFADKAVYEAKSRGRNSVFKYVVNDNSILAYATDK